jgi:hypothetical protein
MTCSGLDCWLGIFNLKNLHQFHGYSQSPFDLVIFIILFVSYLILLLDKNNIGKFVISIYIIELTRKNL